MSSVLAQDVIVLHLPLPPRALRSNTRTSWRQKIAIKQAYSQEVCEAYSLSLPPAYRFTMPWKSARIDYVWRYCGNAPDPTNIPASLKVTQDCLQMAPKSTQENNTWYCGIIEDDKHVEASYRMEQVEACR